MKVEVKIGVGTYSYVMGGAALVNIQEDLPEDIRNRVEVKGAVEIDGCGEDAGKQPPFASVNGKIIEQASREKIIEAIYQEINANTNA